MNGRRLHDRGQGQRHGFLAGPAVAALFRALRRPPPAGEPFKPREFAVQQGTGSPAGAKI